MTPQQFEEQTQSLYRLRNARNKRRRLIEDRDKQLLALSRERDRLWDERRDQPWEVLDPPYQRGWKRSFILRDDIFRSDSAEFYEDILSKINTMQHSSRADFKRKRRKLGRKIYVERGQELQRLEPWEWQHAGFNLKQAALFRLEESTNQWRTVLHYVFTEPWKFQLRVEKNMITKLRKPLSLVESRLDEIDNWLSAHDTDRRRLNRLECSNSRSNRHGKQEARDQLEEKRFKTTPLHKFLDAEAQSQIHSR